MDVSHIHFGGGGASCLVFVGALQYMSVFESDMLKKVRSFSGTSAGSIIMLFFTLGICPQDLIDFFFSKHASFYEKWYDRKVFISRIKDIIEAFHKNLDVENMTFAQHYDLTWKKIHIITTSLDYNEPDIYLSVDNSPDMKIIDAIKMSTNIPIINNVIELGEKKLVDGSITCDIPDKFCHPKSLILLVVHLYDDITDINDPMEIFNRCISLMIKKTHFKEKFPRIFVNIKIKNAEIFPKTKVDFLYLSKLMIKGFEETKTYFKKNV